ncbi:hypothetical protein JCM3774_004423 [Rhodotorula dairenensis]
MPMTPVPDLAVLLLLGGLSSRMGEPKHLLPHPRSRQPLYQHHLETLLQLAAEGTFPEGVFIGARREQLGDLVLPESVQIVLDNPEADGDIGPAAGILQAAVAKPASTWLVLAVDLPFISREAILHLLHSHAATSPVSLYLHSDDGNPEPLFSIWTPTALAQLRTNCRAGKSGPCRAAKNAWGDKIAPGKGGVEVPSEDWITDADTPEEWQAVQQRLMHGENSVHNSTPFDVAISLARTLPPGRGGHAGASVAAGVCAPPSRTPANSGAVPLLASLGHAVDQDIYAKLPHPLQDNSAMDGFAVDSRALASASLDSPVFLPVLGRILAGDPPPPARRTTTTSGCWEIMTGAVLPPGNFDAIVKVEDVLPAADSNGPGLAGFTTPVKSGRHVRRRGEQFRCGDLLVRTGERIGPEKVMLLAAAGISSVPVHCSAVPERRTPRRRAAILTTGKEVVSWNDFASGARLKPGQVVDCISPFLQAVLRSHDCESVLLSSAGDSAAALRAAIDAALRSGSFDLIVTVAGVSLGSADHTPGAMASIGVDTVFHGVAIRPGGPVMLSLHRPSGTPVLSLPGNPMASAVCMRSIGAAVLEALDMSPQANGGDHAGWTEIDLDDDPQTVSWKNWLERLKPGVSTFTALPTSDRGLPTLQSAVSGEVHAGPCALGSLIGAGAWVRADRTAGEGGMDKVFWRSFE